MARLICNSLRAFISPRLIQFQEKKILSWCFKFDDLNLKLAEAIRILKETAQKLRLFETMKIVYFILQYSLLTVFGLDSHYHARIVLGHSSTFPLPLFPVPGVIFHVKSLSDVGFIISSLKYIFRFLHISILDFLDFESVRRPQIVFICFH